MNSPNQPLSQMGNYYLLGRSGLRVSPLCLGTMTFGTDWGWGSPKSAAKEIFSAYVAAGGNFIDTADMYTQGSSETMLGELMAEAGNRDRMVLATKFTFNTKPGDPNGGGNGRKNIMQALEGSLKRLKTDYIDLYWLHCWDGMTPVEEVMTTLDAAVRAGKIRHIGLSDTPAWYLSRAQTIAELRGWSSVCALQLEYSLLERNIEKEHVDAARELGMGICPWSPLGGGMLSGKYQRKLGEVVGSGDGRLQHTIGGPFDRFNERNWKVVDVLCAVAKEMDRSPAQIALNWATKRPGVVSTIIGATKMSQLQDNLGALDFDIPKELWNKLEAVSRPDMHFPYSFFSAERRGGITGGTEVSARPTWW